MTTRVTIKNEDNSNPAQELVIIAHNPCSGGEPFKVLKPGESHELWVASHSHVTIVERQAAGVK